MGTTSASPQKTISPAALRRRRIKQTQLLRHLIQLAFAAFIIYTSVRHHLATEAGTTASIDALCPFGGMETMWRYLVSGRFVPKTHASNLVLFTGLLVGTLLAGSAFCGWICPLGGVQDLLTWIREKLHLPEVQVPRRVDAVLRYGRFLMLGIILYQTAISVKLWFASIDPYRTIFSLDWLFEFQPAAAGIAYMSVILTLVASLFIERAWCRYACPLGGVLSLTGKLSFLRIRRNPESCTGCSCCSRACPVKLPVDTMQTVSSDCIGCLECVDTCPRPDTLEVQLAPIWLEPFRGTRKETTDVR